MAQSADLPRFVISKVDDASRSQAAGGGDDDGAEAQSTGTTVNGNTNPTLDCTNL